jgi:hypothetical protein
MKMMKKIWNAPQLTVHGSVEAITEKTIAKIGGLGDDFATTIENQSNYGDGGVLS